MSIFADEANGKIQLTSIRLGSVDDGAMPTDVGAFFKRYHRDFYAAAPKARNHFRNEANSSWSPFVASRTAGYVAAWQAFLQRAGFLPFHQENGIFGYTTLAGTRLFQEYVRTVEGIAEIGVPDGVVGAKSRAHAHRWETEGKVCHWWTGETPTPSQEYEMWIKLLNDAKAHYQTEPHPVISRVAATPKTGDTRKIDDWAWNPEDIHLLGIRRNQDKAEFNRGNDDLFVLLIRGMVFKFYGSTDPRPASSRSDEAYLVEGQHKYRMAWHKISDVAKVYKALKPYTGAGVMVFRDVAGANALTEANVARGLSGPNNSINIHWTGVGSSNFSEGCQVIAGSSYLNSDNKLVDCSAFASPAYAGLSLGKTRGAYNVLCDLVMAYSPLNQDVVWYTLGRDKVLDLNPNLGAQWAEMMVKNMLIS